MLQELVKCFPDDCLFQAIVMDPRLEINLSGQANCISLEKPRERRWQICSKPQFISNASARLYESWQANDVKRRIVPQLLKFIRRHHIEVLWIVVQGQTMVRLGAELQSQLAMPMYSQLWDPLGWWLRANRIDPSTASELESKFDALMRASVAIGAASWAMAEQYGGKYGVRAVPLIPGIPSRMQQVCDDTATQPKAAFVIGMAGQLYAVEEWKRLLQACQSLNWRVGGKKIKIRLLGAACTIPVSGEVCIEYRGYHTQQSTVQLLSECDVLFLPYWFDARFRQEAELSFPSKLSTYCAAGKPILAHGPSYASPVQFVDSENIGWTVTVDEQSALADTIVESDANVEERSCRGKNASTVFLRELSSDRMRRRFLEFMPFLQSAGAITPEV